MVSAVVTRITRLVLTRLSAAKFRFSVVTRITRLVLTRLSPAKFRFSVVTNATNVEHAVKGFKDAGLFPLDKNAFLKTDKLQTSELFNSGPASVVEQTKNVETARSQSDPEIGVTTQKESTVNVPNTATENTALTNNEKESTEVLATCQTENSSEKITFFRIAIPDYQRQVGLYFIETLQTLLFNHI